MTDIEAKALALLNEIELERGATPYSKLNRHGGAEALCRAIEQHEFTKAAHAATIEGVLKSHEAFRQEVSDKVDAYVYGSGKDGVDEWENLKSLIIPKPKPDPLERLLSVTSSLVDKETLRDRLEAEGLEIREKRQ